MVRFLITAMATVVFSSAAVAQAQSRPNVLMIAVDDLNDWVGCLGGHPQARTPNIDRLAARGIVFTRAYCAVPVCGPSRTALFTGLQPMKTGIYSNGHNPRKVYPGAFYMPQDFARQGYHTMGTGKLLHGGNNTNPLAFSDYGPGYNKWNPLTTAETVISEEELAAAGEFVRHVVDRGPGNLQLTLPLNRMPRDRNRGSDRIESFDWGPINAPDSQWSDTKCADWAIEKLSLAYGRPFFLGVGFYRPHQPLWAPRRYHEMYPPNTVILPETPSGDLDDTPAVARLMGRLAYTSGAHATVVKYGQWRNAVSSYLACISYVDGQIGRLLDALDSSRYAENTIVVLWSDHGWHLGEKQHWGKFTAWERAARVPLVISLPQGMTRTGSRLNARCDAPVGLIDLYPTLMELCGLTPRSHTDGTSLVPLLKDPRAGSLRVALTTVGQGNHSLRSSRWRYIHYFDGSEELYDHAGDPSEYENLADRPEYQEIVRRMRRRLPANGQFAHLIRVGQWKAIVDAATGRLSLYGPDVELLEGSHDVSQDHAEIVTRVRSYLKRHPQAPQYFALEE